MPKIDADAHVVETPRTWSFMRPEEQKFRPQIFVRDLNDGAPVQSNQKNEFWKIGDHFQTKTNVGDNVPADARDMENIKRRLDHMNEIGVDIQVLFPTLFLRPCTTEHDVEFAICRSYNRWLADIWSQSNNRLRWVAAPPLRTLIDPGKVRAELEFCKANGACGIFMRGMECEMLITHRYFDPLWEMAQEFDLCICFHAGNNSFVNHNSYTRDTKLNIFKMPVMTACYHLLGDFVPERFPNLRWAFIEASAQWVPYILNEVGISYKARGRRMPDDVLTRNNFYITTQRTDDLNWLLSEIGDDNLIIGTDYGHKDVAVEIEALKRLGSDGTIPAISADKILDANPTKLYAIAA
jgi:predicted TIM-barrel fold metal-dependent hydrolase